MPAKRQLGRQLANVGARLCPKFGRKRKPKKSPIAEATEQKSSTQQRTTRTAPPLDGPRASCRRIAPRDGDAAELPTTYSESEPETQSDHRDCISCSCHVCLCVQEWMQHRKDEEKAADDLEEQISLQKDYASRFERLQQLRAKRRGDPGQAQDSQPDKQQDRQAVAPAAPQRGPAVMQPRRADQDEDADEDDVDALLDWRKKLV
ncbi:unnamed protein product [Vitrella brassicaformis CCMP3155]|uniref:Uncharacterized protein n=1 Tax=Vitrella brassicaformis (strain CCMP3155) TaxID=1169540 RepID=A0A0G4G6Y9_VITBC|nr:unnamed protein product [Vitrella brassicaformis CCMP3155]|eukprot:CEM24436.1 unnamed protein product [Vitrella brassicaformis CCMP3155]